MPLVIVVRVTTQIIILAIFTLSLYNPFLVNNSSVEIKSWDKERVYIAKIDNKEAYIIFEMENENIITKQKEYKKQKNKDNLTESELVTEYTTPENPKPGKIKIIFKDDKTKGTTLIYERNMNGGEISEVDQRYLDKIFDSINKFHKKNNTVNEKLKDFYSKYIKKK